VKEFELLRKNFSETGNFGAQRVLLLARAHGCRVVVRSALMLSASLQALASTSTSTWG